jgi:hypothetical protein
MSQSPHLDISLFFFAAIRSGRKNKMLSLGEKENPGA